MPRRLLIGFGAGVVGLGVLALIGVLILFLRLAAGPIDLAPYAGRLDAALAERFGSGWRVDLAETTLELAGTKPAIRAKGLEIFNPMGAPVVRAPFALVSLNPFSLLLGRISPHDIELRDLHLRGEVGEDGAISFSSSVETAAVPPPAPPAETVANPPALVSEDAHPPSVVAAIATSLLRPLIRSGGIVGGLDRAKLVDAKLTLVGSGGRERVAFDGVDALFEKVGLDDRRFGIELRGERGTWRLAGQVSGTGKGQVATIKVEGVPASDLALLTGWSSAGRTDVRLDGSLAAAFVKDRLHRIEARLSASSGRIERQDLPPVRLDAAEAELTWEEDGRVLSMDHFRVRSQGTYFDLKGRMTGNQDGSWGLVLGARDVTVADLDPARPAFRLDSVDATARLSRDGMVLETATARGPDVSIRASARYTPAVVTEVFRSDLTVTGSDARKILRLWPDDLNPELRAGLAKRISGGTVDALSMTMSLDARDMAVLPTHAPISDTALDLKLDASGINFAAADGMPALHDLRLQGRSSGRTVHIQAMSGRMDAGSGRSLGISEGTFVFRHTDAPQNDAAVAFRLRGGLDAFAALVRSPGLRIPAAPDIDPGNVRGEADLRVSVTIPGGKLLPGQDLLFAVSGTASDVSVEKVIGSERLESGQFTISQTGPSLTVTGDARIGGVPASFDLRMPRLGSGELQVQASLDDAARARRSLPTAPLLSGAVVLKALVPIGTKAPTRVELDLTRASVDGLLPGWLKASGKPGRAGFQLLDGEVRELFLDSGTVQAKGTASLTAVGAIEKVELASFRVSPGDDMKVAVERTSGGYKVALRGNNADARGLLRWMGTPPKPAAREAVEVDFDVALSILSGFNDEAMTSVSAKGQTRGGELKALQFAGRFRNAPLEASVGKRDAGAPVLSVRAHDAGATLRFLDFYRRMTGGRMALEARIGDASQEGQITIDEFGLRSEPALRRIVAQSQQGSSGTDERGAAPVSRQDLDQVLFTRLTTSFRRVGARTDYTDAVIYGPQVGFNLSGWIDTVRDRLDINGTFVPAYLLNNAFSQIPVVGMILGGGRTEGLIAVDFRVNGPVGSPTVTVNPLTAVAPGILRKLFGWMMPDGQAEAAEPQAAQPPTQRRRTR